MRNNADYANGPNIKTYLCPSMSKYGVAYIPNTYLLNTMQDAYTGDCQPKKLSSLKHNASIQLVFVDGATDIDNNIYIIAGWQATNSITLEVNRYCFWNIRAIHRGLANASFLDGHVESKTVQDFQKDYQSYENSGFMKTHPTMIFW